MRRQQTGATLIVVLIFLILIMTVSAIAVRQSVTDLKVATNDQVDTLLLNTADSVPSYLEEAINTPGNHHTALMASTAPFGAFISKGGVATIGDEVIFCYMPRQNLFYSVDRASLLTPNGGARIIGSGNGYCDSANPQHYTNARNNTMVQVMITKPLPTNMPSGTFPDTPLGGAAGVNDPKSHVFEVYSTSLLPAVSSVNDGKINECLRQPNIAADRFLAGAGNQTLSACLLSRGVPAKVIVEQVELNNGGVTEVCINLGRGDGNVSVACRTKFGLNANGTSNLNANGT